MSTNFPVIGEIEVSWRERAAVLVIIAAVVLAAPQFVGSYWTNVGIDMMIVVLFAMSFNLLFGYTGLLSFGHAGFYGFAAYLVALSLSGGALILPGVNSFIPAILLAIVGTMLLAALFGALCVQRGGIFFAMLTLALNMMVYEIAVQWDDISGGVNGTTVPAPMVDLGFITFSALDKGAYYYFTFALVVLSLILMWRIVRSPYGELLKALRENPERVEFVGLNVKFYQWTAFVLSGFFAGLAGALVSIQIFVVSPIVVHWSTSAVPVLSTLIGGPTAFFGPVVGGIIFILLEEALTSVTQFWQIGVGIILIPIVLFFPGGLVGTLTGDGGVFENIPMLGGSAEEAEGEQ